MLPQGYVVDFALTAHKIAVVVDGADHFVGSSDVLRGEVPLPPASSSPLHEPLMLTASPSFRRQVALKHRQLRALGWTLVALPYFEWQPLRLLPEPRRAYVHEILAANWPEEAVAEEAAGAEGGAAPEEGAAAEAAPTEA